MKLKLVTPQFDREDGVEPDPHPESREDWELLRDCTPEQLTDMGLRPWDGDLFLFPAEWYDHIPEGFDVTSINDETEPFDPATHTDDRRFGVLAYGVVPDAD